MAALTGYGMGVKLEILGTGKLDEPLVLACNCGMLDCEHRKVAMRDGAEVEELWRRVSENDLVARGAFYVGVQLVPGAAVKVSLTTTEAPTLFATYVVARGDEIDCGLVTSTSGLFDVRNKVVDAVTTMTAEPPRCESEFHRRNAPQDTKPDILCRTLWSLCWSCRKRKAQRLDDPERPDVSDLQVPF